LARDISLARHIFREISWKIPKTPTLSKYMMLIDLWSSLLKSVFQSLNTVLGSNSAKLWLLRNIIALMMQGMVMEMAIH